MIKIRRIGIKLIKIRNNRFRLLIENLNLNFLKSIKNSKKKGIKIRICFIKNIKGFAK